MLGARFGRRSNKVGEATVPMRPSYIPPRPLKLDQKVEYIKKLKDIVS